MKSCEFSIVSPDKRERHVPGNRKHTQGTIDASSDFLNKIPKIYQSLFI